MIATLTGCNSIKQIGQIGPKSLPVIKVSSNDFLTASRMLIVLDERGNIVAYVGGTTAGAGTVTLGVAGQAATAASVVYAGRELAQAIRNASIAVKGIPDTVKVLPVLPTSLLSFGDIPIHPVPP